MVEQDEEQFGLRPIGPTAKLTYRLQMHVDEKTAATILRGYGFDEGYATGAQNLNQDSSLEDVGSLLHQTGIASATDDFLVDEEKSVMRLKPSEHKKNPGRCYWTLGWVEGAVASFKRGDVRAELRTCVSDKRSPLCTYVLQTTPRAELKSIYPDRSAYFIPDEDGALRHFTRALREGRPGLAVTQYPEGAVEARLPGLRISHKEVGDGAGADVSPLSPGTFHDTWRDTIRKTPEVAILFTATETVSRIAEDTTVTRVLSSLVDEVLNPYSSAVAFVVIPERLRGRFPLAERFYKTELPTF